MNRRSLSVLALAVTIATGCMAVAGSTRLKPGTSPPAKAQGAGSSPPVAHRNPVRSTSLAYKRPGLPDNAARMAALRRRYQDDLRFRQMIADFNAMQGHPGRGEAATLQALDQLAVKGAPATALFQAVQPRPAILRALQQHWDDEHQGAPQAAP